ncbi:MAG: hypothetical protein R3Y11_12005 [Pseudomonadota bacterium]
MGIDSIGSQTSLTTPQNTATQGVKEAPAALHGARAVAKTAARVVAGLLTAGLSEGILAIHRGVQSYRTEKARVAEARAAELAQARIDTSNSSLATNLQSGNDLPEPMAQAVHEAMQDLRTSFGDANVPVTEVDINTWSTCGTICATIRANHAETSPADLKALLIEHGHTRVLDRAINALFTNLKAEEGLTDTITSPVSRFTGPALDGLHTGLKDCQNADDVQALFAQYKTPLKEALTFTAEAKEIIHTLHKEGVAFVVQHTGLSTQTVEDSGAMRRFDRKAADLRDDLRMQENPPRGDALKETFTALLTTTMDGKEDLMATAENLPISQGLKQDFKDTVFTSDSFKDPKVFINGALTAQNIHTANLVALLASPDAHTTDEELTGMFQSIAAQINDNMAQAYGDAFKNLDGYERSNARYVSTAIFLDQNPAFVAALRAKPAMIERVAQYLDASTMEEIESERDQAMSAYNSYVRHIVGTVSDDYATTNTNLSEDISMVWGCTIRQHDAINTAIESIHTQFGDGFIPDGNTLAEINESPAGKAIVRSLETAITQADHVVSPQELHSMVYGTLQNAVVKHVALNLIQSSAQSAGTPLSKYSASNMLEMLQSRHPDLSATFKAATNLGMITDALEAIPDYQAIQQYTFDMEMEGLKERVFDRVTEELATALITTPEDLKKDFNPNNSMGSAVHNIAMDINEATAKPNAAIPNAAQIQEKFTAKIHSVVHEKVILVDALFSSTHGVQNRPLSHEALVDLRFRLLQTASVRKPEFLQYCTNITALLDPDACIAALNAEDYDSALQALKQLGRDILSLAHEVIPAEVFSQMDPDETSSIGHFVQTMLLGSSTELHAALNNNKELITDIRTTLENDLHKITRQITRIGDDEEKLALLSAHYGSIGQTLSILNDILEK